MSKLRITISVDPAAPAQKSGIGYYTSGLVDALAQNYPDIQITGHYYNFLGRQPIADLPQAPNIRYKVSRFIPQKLTNLLRRLGVEIPFELLTKTKANIHIFPNYLTQPSIYNTPSICAIHDLAFIDQPQTISTRNLHDLTRFVPRSIKRAKTLATISDFTRQRIINQYQPKQDIIVTHIPVQPPTNATADLTKLGITGKYVLFIGNLEPRKNLTRLVQAYQQLPSDTRQTYALVLAGGKGWNSQPIQDAIQQAQQAGCTIITTGYVSEAERSALYQHASVFAFPSLYEGYGMPPLEAMQYQIPVLASNIPVLQETCGNAALFCNPEDTGDITSKLNELLTNPSLRTDLIAKGNAQATKTTWQAFAAVFYAAIQDSI